MRETENNCAVCERPITPERNDEFGICARCERTRRRESAESMEWGEKVIDYGISTTYPHCAIGPVKKGGRG